MLKGESDFHSAWEKSFEKHARDTSSISKPLLLKKRLLEKRFPELRDFISQRKQTHTKEVEIEKILTADNGTLEGQLDLLLLGDSAVVLDHKSGMSNRNYPVKDSYKKQLAFYSYLVEQNYSVENIECWLFFIREGLVQVPISKQERRELIDTVHANVKAYNQRVPNQQPANPTDSNCSWCEHCGECGGFWEAIESGALNAISSGEAISGVILDGMVSAKNGKSTFRVDVQQGTRKGNVMIQEVPTKLLHENELSSGKSVKAFRLFGKEEDETLIWRLGRSQFSL